MMRPRTATLTSLLLASGGFAIAACSSSPPPPNAALEQAHQTYAAASNDAVVRQAGARDLENAADSLDIADHAWKSKEDKTTVDHYAYLAQRYSEVAQESAKVRTAALEATSTARKITLGDMLFATGKADLNPQGQKAVADLATFLRNYPDRTVTIVGYTDSTGSAKTNAALSEKRAEAVRTALASEGIDASRIQARGMGPSNPVASNKTASGRQANRRVEIDLSGQGVTTGVGTSVPQ